MIKVDCVTWFLMSLVDCRISFRCSSPKQFRGGECKRKEARQMEAAVPVLRRYMGSIDIFLRHQSGNPWPCLNSTQLMPWVRPTTMRPSATTVSPRGDAEVNLVFDDLCFTSGLPEAICPQCTPLGFYNASTCSTLLPLISCATFTA